MPSAVLAWHNDMTRLDFERLGNQLQAKHLDLEDELWQVGDKYHTHHHQARGYQAQKILAWGMSLTDAELDLF